MQGDLVDLLGGLAQQVRNLGRHILVAGAVEAVAANVVLVGDVLLNGVVRRVLRQRGEERGVEHGHVRHVLQQRAGVFDAVDVGGVVQRR